MFPTLHSANARQHFPVVKTGSTPTSSVRSRSNLWARATLVLAALVASTACSDGEDQVVEPVVVGISANTASFYDDGETTLFQAQTQVVLPVRRPRADEAAALGASPPFPKAPFLQAKDVDITIRYTITNLDDARHAVELLIDPWNEFVRYRPGLRVSEEGTTPDFSGFDKFFVLPPKGRIQGTITPDDTRELAIDLATAENILATPPTDPAANVNAWINRLFYLQNRSSVPDPLISKFIPKVTPGLTGFDAGLRAYEKMNVALEILIDVVDIQGDRTTEPGKIADAMGVPPAEITPPAPPME